MEAAASTAAADHGTALAGTSVSGTANALDTRNILPFERLAPELRNRIYEEVLVADSELILNQRYPKPPFGPGDSVGFKAELQGLDPRTNMYKWDPFGQTHNVAILRLNKSIHREARDILYGQNRFFFTDSINVEAFVTRHPNGSKLITAIRVYLMGFDGKTALIQLPSLKRLELRIGTCSVRTLDGYADKVYWGWVSSIARNQNRYTCSHGFECICNSKPATETVMNLLKLDTAYTAIIKNPSDHNSRSFKPKKHMAKLMRLIVKNWEKDVFDCKVRVARNAETGE
jgi:hypothetical protein